MNLLYKDHANIIARSAARRVYCTNDATLATPTGWFGTWVFEMHDGKDAGQEVTILTDRKAGATQFMSVNNNPDNLLSYAQAKRTAKVYAREVGCTRIEFTAWGTK